MDDHLVNIGIKHIIYGADEILHLILVCFEFNLPNKFP